MSTFQYTCHWHLSLQAIFNHKIYGSEVEQSFVSLTEPDCDSLVANAFPGVALRGGGVWIVTSDLTGLGTNSQDLDKILPVLPLVEVFPYQLPQKVKIA